MTILPVAFHEERNEGGGMHQIDFDRLRRHTKYYAVLNLVPFLLWFVNAWSNAVGFLLTLFVLPAIYLIAVVVTCRWSLVAWRSGKAETPWRWRFAVAFSPMALFGLSLLFFSPLAKAGDMAGALTRLAVNHRRYEAIIAGASANSVGQFYETANGITYSVDAGPPVRVAFNPEGFLDNWSGVIYDPTGEVMRADGWDPASGKFRAPDRITKIFGGDLVACRHLWGDYYDCSFT